MGNALTTTAETSVGVLTILRSAGRRTTSDAYRIAMSEETSPTVVGDKLNISVQVSEGFSFLVEQLSDNDKPLPAKRSCTLSGVGIL